VNKICGKMQGSLLLQYVVLIVTTGLQVFAGFTSIAFDYIWLYIASPALSNEDSSEFTPSHFTNQRSC
jgi:hypothetical protein